MNPEPGGRRSAGGVEAVLERLDAAVEDAVGALRGRPGVDLTAAVVSNLADYGALWVVLAARKARAGGRPRRRAVLALATAGVSSYLVNKAVKATVGRARPAPGAVPLARRLPVRAPSSTSFPSGHTLAAACTAVVLAESRRETATLLGVAGAVGLSRVYLGHHHGSDVVAGLAVGTALGLAGKRVVDALT